MAELRLALVYQVRQSGRPVAQVCREFGVSRKTAYKWLDRADDHPGRPLEDRSRRPRRSPRATPDHAVQALLRAHTQFGWGARKLQAYLIRRGHALPSVRTVHHILLTHGRVRTPDIQAPIHFERPAPHDLWQMDFKGKIEVDRRPIHPLTVLDDHSRFCLMLKPMTSHHHQPLWEALWDCFGQFGLPRQLLCDNEFSTGFQKPRTITWLEANLLRLDIQPIHGRPYHPQTQGKVERFHGTMQREMAPRARRDCLENFALDMAQFRNIYNLMRPHEALEDEPPITRLRPNPRRRPDRMPAVEYPGDAQVRKVGQVGEISWKGRRILAGRGLVDQYVRIEEQSTQLAVFYCNHLVRAIPLHALNDQNML